MNNKMSGVQSLRSRRVSPLVFHVLPENFKSGTADQAQEKAAGPERPLVLAPGLRTTRSRNAEADLLLSAPMVGG